MEFSAKQLAGLLGGKIVGNPDVTVNNISKIEEGTEGTLSFLANPKYTPYIYNTKASIVLVNNDFEPEKPISATLIKVENSYLALAKLLELYNSETTMQEGIHPMAFVHPEAKVGKKVYIGAFAYIDKGVVIEDTAQIYPHVFIGRNSKIGSQTCLYSGVKIYHEVVVGNNCTIHSGTVIGADGFGFVPQSDSEFVKVKQVGNVVIEDNVEIGANTCVDRATLGSTVIHKGVKLDNLIQVGHNADIGDATVIAALSGVSGTVKIGKNCMIGGQSGFAGHIKVGNGVMVGAKTGISHDVEDYKKMVGAPAMEGHEYHRCYAVFRHLPDIMHRLNQLEKYIKEKEK